MFTDILVPTFINITVAESHSTPPSVYCSFLVAISILWNSLPVEVVTGFNICLLLTLKTNLFQKSFPDIMQL